MGVFGIGVYQPIAQIPPGTIKSSTLSSGSPGNLVSSGGIPGVSTKLYAAAVEQDSPVIFTPLSDHYGRLASDASGHGYTAQLFGEAVLGYYSGPLQGPGEQNQTSLFLDGQSGYLVYPYPNVDPGLLRWGQFSVEMWINPFGVGATNNPRLICNSHTDLDKQGVQLFLHNNGILEADMGNGSVLAAITSTSAVPFDAWSYVVLTWDGTQVLLYVNAQQQGAASLTGPLAVGKTPFNVGRNQAYNGDFFHGLIGPTVIYNGVLNLTDILYHYEVGITRGPTVVGNGFVPAPGTLAPPSSGIYGGQYGYVIYTTVRGPKLAQPQPAPTIGNDNLGNPVVRSFPSTVWSYSSLRPDYWYYFKWLYKLAGTAPPGYQYLVLLQQPDLSGNNVPIQQLARWEPPVASYRTVGAFLGAQLTFTYIGQAILGPNVPIVTVTW
jgi:hypothetical protein